MTKDELLMAAEYDRGYHDGKAAYDADQWQVRHDRMEAASRMRKLTLNMGSHENLAAICECIYEPAVNWSRGACEMLRTRLTRLLVADIADYDYHDHSKPTMRRELTVDALLDLIRDAAEDYEELLVANDLQADVLDACMQQNKELRRELDGYEESHIELPKDVDGKRIVIGDILHDYEDGNDFHVDGFKIWGMSYKWWAYQENACQYPVHHCLLVQKCSDTAESIVRDLTLGNISESDAIARIEKLGSQHE